MTRSGEILSKLEPTTDQRTGKSRLYQRIPAVAPTGSRRAKSPSQAPGRGHRRKAATPYPQVDRYIRSRRDREILAIDLHAATSGAQL